MRSFISLTKTTIWYLSTCKPFNKKMIVQSFHQLSTSKNEVSVALQWNGYRWSDKWNFMSNGNLFFSGEKIVCTFQIVSIHKVCIKYYRLLKGRRKSTECRLKVAPIYEKWNVFIWRLTEQKTKNMNTILAFL